MADIIGFSSSPDERLNALPERHFVTGRGRLDHVSSSGLPSAVTPRGSPL
jgi:hypothetical protein